MASYSLSAAERGTMFRGANVSSGDVFWWRSRMRDTGQGEVVLGLLH